MATLPATEAVKLPVALATRPRGSGRVGGGARCGSSWNPSSLRTDAARSVSMSPRLERMYVDVDFRT